MHKVSGRQVWDSGRRYGKSTHQIELAFGVQDFT